MYAGTGISTDSARRKKAKKWARWTARQCKELFQADPMPGLQTPDWNVAPSTGAIAMSGPISAIQFNILPEEE